MNSLNHCAFIGNVARDPETRYLPSGDAVCTFSIGCNWKTKEKEGVEWVRISAFGKLAEIVGEYCKKGQQVYVSGRLTTRKWQNKEGQDQYSTEIVADRLQMLGGKRDGAQKPDEREPETAGAGANDDDSIPF